MTQPPVLPDRPEDEEWDVVVVGTGMGGGTAGFALAEKGLKVLFIEKGLYLFDDHDRGRGSIDEAPVEPHARMSKGLWPARLSGETTFGPIEFFGPLGCGTGGSSSLYASQLERMRPADFEPRRNHPQATDANLPERWPFSYEEMLPYYRRAEVLYDVCGTEDPLLPDPEAQLRPPPPMSERDALVFDLAQEAGLSPYRAHVGALFKEGCVGCGGALCPRDCKADSGRNGVLPALRHGARILPQTEVLHFEGSKDRVERVICRRGEKTLRISARGFVLAAGAYMSPVILLRSRSPHWANGLANGSDQVGRNLMMHASDQIAVRPPKKLPADGPQKAISTNYFYLKNGQKLGNLQSMGVPIGSGVISEFLRQKAEKERSWYLQLGKVGRKVASKVGAALFSQAVLMASIVEDLPYLQNRVTLDDRSPDGRRFDYTYPDELGRRSKLMVSETKKALEKHMVTQVLSNENNLNWGHPCGTCRAGEDPATSVVDAVGRAHEVENLWVADSSFFPSSGGINPSLTIAANALRVAEAAARDLGR
jgi:choline dehydrogenase-like flavoprotein